MSSASTSKTVVLITGANTGIGFDTASLLATESDDYHVILGARALEKGETAVSKILKEKANASVSLVQIDVTDHKSIHDAAGTVEREFGKLDVLINNAGIVPAFTESLATQLRAAYETNTIGAAVTTEAFIELLKKSANPRLIHVSSDLGSIGLRSDPEYKYYGVPATAYRMSKAALNMLAACHYKEYKSAGVKVFAFNPGYVVTNLTGEADRERRVKTGAKPSTISAHDVLNIVQGKRDSDVGCFIHGDAGDVGGQTYGKHPW